MPVPQRVLIVDDEPILVQTIAFNLRRAGFEVADAFDGESGLRAARETRPDLVLLDVMLPGISGRDVCRALREDAPWRPKVLMLTASGEGGEREKCLRAGADAFLLKPFAMTELVALVKDLLGPGAVQAAPEAKAGNPRARSSSG